MIMTWSLTTLVLFICHTGLDPVSRCFITSDSNIFNINYEKIYEFKEN